MKAYLVLAVLLAPFCFATVLYGQPQKSAAMKVVPVFAVDARFPTMPDHMLMGGVGGVTADSHGNVWVFQRPHTLEEGNAMENGYVPAPPVLEFSATANLSGGGAVRQRGSRISGSIAEDYIRHLPSARHAQPSDV